MSSKTGANCWHGPHPREGQGESSKVRHVEIIIGALTRCVKIDEVRLGTVDDLLVVGVWSERLHGRRQILHGPISQTVGVSTEAIIGKVALGKKKRRLNDVELFHHDMH